MEKVINSYQTQNEINEQHELPGWGIAADPENDPGYPMKDWNGDDHFRLDYERAVQQPQDVEVLKSIERPVITRVFGTAVPPSGWSGRLRRYAFRKYSEGHGMHWMTLILADRINVFEGILDDLRKGYVPNIFAERGIKSEFKYNRKAAITKVAIGLAVTGILIAFLSERRKKIAKA